MDNRISGIEVCNTLRTLTVHPDDENQITPNLVHSRELPQNRHVAVLCVIFIYASLHVSSSGILMCYSVHFEHIAANTLLFIPL
jgi:hypothetical protein